MRAKRGSKPTAANMIKATNVFRNLFILLGFLKVAPYQETHLFHAAQ
jgi:hypothetical protein